MIQTAKMTASSDSQKAQSGDGPTAHTITIYRNGFTVDDGPLRDSEEEQNKKFLSDISKGFIPAEFVEEVQAKGTQNVSIGLSDKREVSQLLVTVR